MNEYSSNLSFIDLKSQQQNIRENIELAISRVLDHGQYIMGPEVKRLETELQINSGADHVITCANGTDALTLVLMAWGINPGDVVLIPSFTYVASAEAAARLGAIPFFVDVCKNTFNMSPKSLELAIVECDKRGLEIKVIIAVDLFGQPAEIDEITQIAKNNNLRVLVDGAQSFGASSKGRPVGSLGDATTTSFFPAKPLGCYGDGGAVFTNDEKTAEIVRSLSLHGRGDHKYDHVRVGVNSRLDTIQAAILLEKMKIFPKELERKQWLADFYSQKLTDVISTPYILEHNTTSWAQYTLMHKQRDKVVNRLSASSIPAAIYYPKALTQQPAYKQYPTLLKGTPVSEFLSQSVFSIPMHPYMSESDANHIISTLHGAI